MLFIDFDEPQHPRKWLHRFEAVAHVTTAAAFALTIVLVTTAFATELNFIADTLFGSVGWAATGIAALLAIAAAFQYYEENVEEYPHLMLSAGAFLAAAGVADLAINVWLLYRVGVPPSIHLEAYGQAVASVLIVGAVTSTRHLYLPAVIEGLRTHRSGLRAVGFALLVSVSLVAMPFMGGIAPERADHDGTAAAASADGIVFGGVGTGQQKAYDANDGTLLWAKGSSGPSGVVRNPDGETVYFLDGSNLIARNPSDGSTKWNVSDGGLEVAVSHDGSTLYIGDSGGGVRARSTSDGSQKWSASPHSDTIEELVVGPDGNKLYSSSKDNSHKALDSTDGSTIWTQSFSAYDHWAMIPGPNGDYVYGSHETGGSNTMAKMDATDGSVVWESGVTETNYPYDLTMDPDGTTLYAGEFNGWTTAVDPSDGSLIWSNQTNSNNINEINTGPDGDVLYSADSDDNLKAYTVSDRTSLWAGAGRQAVDAGGETVPPNNPVSGQVTDSDGDPVPNATVYATGYDAASPPTIDGTPFDEIQDDPLPDGWDAQTDTDWADQGRIDVEEADFQEKRVLMHSDDKWDISGGWPDTTVWNKEINPYPDLAPAPSTVSDDDNVIFSCWSPKTSLIEDEFDAAVPGMTSTACDITIQRLDPTGDVQHEDAVETRPAVKVTALGNFGSKEHHAYYAGDMSTGIYHVYPDDSPEAGIYYAVAPDGQVTKLESEIENWASSRSDAISNYNQEIKNEYDAGNLELVSTETNSTGHYSMDVPNQATEAELRVIKDGGESAASPGDLTRTDLREEYDSTVRGNFNAASGVNFDDADEETFVSVCRRMDPVADDVGIPFQGSGETEIPNQNADIQGEYLIPKDLDPQIRKCAAISIVESLLDGDLGWMSPGLADNLADLTDGELEEMLSMVQSMLGTNDVLCEEYADAVGAASCEDVLEDPSDLTRSELENRVTEGYDTVDDSSDNMNGGGGGGIVGGGGGVGVGDADTSVGDETFSSDWNVGGVSDWGDASLMLRLTWSNGTTTVLNESSEYVSVDESAFGSDTVKLTDYPIGDSDPAAVQARLDVVTKESTGSGDTGAVKNPTWNGDLPKLNSLKVSKWEPGEDDSFTVGVDEEDNSRFGSLQRVEVTSPDGTTTTYTTVEDGEITAQTKNAGDHRVAVVFTAADDNATEFTEVVQVRAGSTSKGRPPSIRGQSGAIGRYAVVGHGLDAGEVDVARGGSEVTMTGVLPQDADVPQTLTADTTDVSVATDATTTIRLRRGATRQTIRDRINVVLYADEIDDDALVWRHGDALTREGTQWGEVTVKNGTTVDTISDETASVAIRVNGDPSVVDRVRHWVSANVNVPSLPIGMAAFDPDVLLVVGALVAARRRDPPEPPTPDVREHRQPNPQEV